MSNLSVRRLERVVRSAVDIESSPRDPADFVGFGLNWCFRRSASCLISTPYDQRMDTYRFGVNKPKAVTLGTNGLHVGVVESPVLILRVVKHPGNRLLSPQVATGEAQGKGLWAA